MTRSEHRLLQALEQLSSGQFCLSSPLHTPSYSELLRCLHNTAARLTIPGFWRRTWDKVGCNPTSSSEGIGMRVSMTVQYPAVDRADSNSVTGVVIAKRQPSQPNTTNTHLNDPGKTPKIPQLAVCQSGE